MSTRILVVDDDTALSEMIGIMLTAEGYEPSYCADGATTIDVFHKSDPDLVLLDLMLPGVDGVEICRHIREESDVPVIMLTARTDTQDVVAGLEAGADDYVTKPFKSKELLARVRTRLRRTSDGGNAEHVRAGDLDIDVAGHQVRRGEVEIGLTPLEFDLEGVHPRGASRAGVGLPARRRHATRQRARPAAARQDRARSRASGDRGDRPRRGLPRRRARLIRPAALGS